MHRQLIDTRYTRYINKRSLLLLLESLFGNTGWTIEETDSERLILEIPRGLTEDEIRVVACYAILQAESELLSDANFSYSVPNATPSKDLSSERMEDIYLATPSKDGKVYVPTDIVQDTVPSGYGMQNATGLVWGMRGQDREKDKVSSYIYQEELSQGESCLVYKLTAQILWVNELSSDDGYKVTQKLACKRLKKATTPQQFLREYDTLQTVNKTHHPNIVQLRAAFRYEENNSITYNLLFPLAFGTLKEMMMRPLKEELNTDRMQTLWAQFKGLASALAYLHDDCGTAHRDLKSSNILLYKHASAPRLVAKIADFGLAVGLRNAKDWTTGTSEAKSAIKYGAPEIRRYHHQTSAQHPTFEFLSSSDIPFQFPSAGELRVADIWSLGCVFSEMLTFLIKGQDGVANFRRARRTTRGNLTACDFDDGSRVKKEVLDWLSGLETLDRRASEIVPSITEMLSEGPIRPRAAAIFNRIPIMRETTQDLDPIKPFIGDGFVSESTLLLARSPSLVSYDTFEQLPQVEQASSPISRTSFRLKLLITNCMGWLFRGHEAPVKEGKQRIDWNCVCGKRFHVDISSSDPSATDIVQHNPWAGKQTSLGNKLNLNAGRVDHNSQNNAQRSQIITAPDTEHGPEHVGNLDDENPRDGSREEGEHNNPAFPPGWLLLCIPNHRIARVSHNELTSTKTDVTLFHELRKSYYSKQSKWSSIFQLRAVTRLKLVRFDVLGTNHNKSEELLAALEPEWHWPVCREGDTLSWHYKLESEFAKAKKGDGVASQLEAWMMHLWQSSDHYTSSYPHLIFNATPKRCGAKLCANTGWGIYIEEGFVIAWVAVIMFSLCPVGAIVFAIAGAAEHWGWAALGGSSLMVGTGAIMVTIWVAKAKDSEA